MMVLGLGFIIAPRWFYMLAHFHQTSSYSDDKSRLNKNRKLNKTTWSKIQYQSIRSRWRMITVVVGFCFLLTFGRNNRHLPRTYSVIHDKEDRF